ncbi:MAG TPA: SpoIIE family protein phosphatase, partial [bacterium]|nr:SpoIIE family protein phosphatase [bacterium]
SILEEMDLFLREEPDFRKAEEYLQSGCFDLILLDMESVAQDSAEVCAGLLKAGRQRSVPLLLVAGEKDPTLLMDALRAGADDFIRKPVQAYEILVRVRSALCSRAWERHAKRSRDRVAIIAQIVFGMNMGIELQDAVAPVLPQISGLLGADLAFLISIGGEGTEVDRIYPVLQEPEDYLVPAIEPLVEETLLKGEASFFVDVTEPEGETESSAVSEPYRSGMVIPVVEREDMMGLLCVARRLPIPFSQRDVDSVSVICDTLAISVSRARWFGELAESHRIIRREIEMLGHLQKLLLPQSLPKYPGLKFEAFYQPAREAGGDYYDVIQLTDKDIAIVVADVSGHGAPAAMNMGIARSILHTVSLSQQISPSQTMFFLNKLLCRLLGENAHITMFYGVLDLQAWTFRWTSAGHVPGMIYRAAERTPEPIAAQSSGPPLGWWTDAEFEEQVSVLQEKDLLLLYTDGLIEAMNERRRPFEIEGIRNVLEKLGDADLKGAVESILTAFQEHVGEGILEDDVTLIGFQRSGD